MFDGGVVGDCAVRGLALLVPNAYMPWKGARKTRRAMTNRNGKDARHHLIARGDRPSAVRPAQSGLGLRTITSFSQLPGKVRAKHRTFSTGILST